MNDDMDAFRRFIEESLNLDGLGESDKPLNRLSPGYAPTSKRYATLPQDLRASWNELQQQGIDLDYLGSMLTDFERRVRSGLQDELVALLGRYFADRLSDAELRGLMTAGWLVLGQLSAKYADEDAADDMSDLF